MGGKANAFENEHTKSIERLIQDARDFVSHELVDLSYAGNVATIVLACMDDIENIKQWISRSVCHRCLKTIDDCDCTWSYSEPTKAPEKSNNQIHPAIAPAIEELIAPPRLYKAIETCKSCGKQMFAGKCICAGDVTPTFRCLTKLARGFLDSQEPVPAKVLEMLELSV